MICFFYLSLCCNIRVCDFIIFIIMGTVEIYGNFAKEKEQNFVRKKVVKIIYST